MMSATVRLRMGVMLSFGVAAGDGTSGGAGMLLRVRANPESRSADGLVGAPAIHSPRISAVPRVGRVRTDADRVAE
ncbi:hypothetical protein GCM10009573_18840 [Agromyces bracchium]